MVGVAYAFVAYLAWGILPIYWKWLDQVPAGEVLAHRVFWSFIFVAGVVAVYGKWGTLKKTFSDRKSRFAMCACSVLISSNWFIYIYAVHTNKLVEASLGYYITPLLSILLATTVLKEKLNFWQGVALVFAFAGVLVIALQYGGLPWIAFALSISFAIYGLLKKMANLDSITGLAMETAFVMPIALIYILIIQHSGRGAFHVSPDINTILLIGSGVATAIPLLWFAQAANRASLATIGFIQYLAPSISLLIGVFLFHEPFTKHHLISFAFIWVALLIYSCANTNVMRQLQQRIYKVTAR